MTLRAWIRWRAALQEERLEVVRTAVSAFLEYSAHVEAIGTNVDAVRREIAHLTSTLDRRLEHLIVATGHSGGR